MVLRMNNDGLADCTFNFLLLTFYISIHSHVFSAFSSKITRKVNGTKKKKKKLNAYCYLLTFCNLCTYEYRATDFLGTVCVVILLLQHHPRTHARLLLPTHETRPRPRKLQTETLVAQIATGRKPPKAAIDYYYIYNIIILLLSNNTKIIIYR